MLIVLCHHAGFYYSVMLVALCCFGMLFNFKAGHIFLSHITSSDFILN